MILIDAREGLSGDMLVAGMLDLLDDMKARDVSRRIQKAAAAHGIAFTSAEVEEDGDKGLAVNYGPSNEHAGHVSQEDALALLEEYEDILGSRSSVGKLMLKEIVEAESEAHCVPVKEVHLHEIGRPQGILNMAAIGLMSHMLVEDGAEGFVASKVVTGKGITVMSHGAIRIPPPAARILLRGLVHEEGDASGERATPTGIAALKVLAKSQIETVPTDRIERMGVGFGTKRFGGRLGRTVLLRYRALNPTGI